jgi:hypothetical protein
MSTGLIAAPESSFDIVKESMAITSVRIGFWPRSVRQADVKQHMSIFM